MEKQKIKFYVEPKGFLAQTSMILMGLAVICRLIGCWGLWTDEFYAVTQIALPIASGLLFILLVLLLGRRALWLTSIPVLMGVAFFIIKSFGFESKLHTVLCVLLYILIAVLYVGTVFALIRTKWLLVPLFALPFLYHIFVEDLAARGVRILNGPEELREAAPGTIVIRSHGVSRAEQEEMERLGFTVEDATCPFVKKIHRMAQEAGTQGRDVIIVGDPAHPEVRAIVGWCEKKPLIVEKEEDIPQIPTDRPVTVLSQTTFNQDKFQKLVEIIKKSFYNAFVVNTICHATQRRQQEAEELARMADAMIVIGGSQSSNTRKLAEICEANCAKTYYIQALADLKAQGFRPVRFVGITAGASTPKNIIEEVQNFVGSEF